MKILLHENSLNLRGSSVALFDYAYYLKTLFNHDVSVVYNKTEHTNDQKVKSKFKDNFIVYEYTDFSEVQNLVRDTRPDVFYIIKSGNNDGKVVWGPRNCIHAVFPHSIDDKHGDVYACVSSWLSQYISNSELPFVPHMINLPMIKGDFRGKLYIPQDATVFGRYGGLDSFDITFAMEAVMEVLSIRQDIYFLFCNTYPFINHPRVIFVNGTASLEDKAKFINTCDALLHARLRGETFGLTILEFMSKQKPIFTYADSPERNHYGLLAGQGYLYKEKEDLIRQLVTFNKHFVDYTELQNYLPERVMQKFNSVFLQ